MKNRNQYKIWKSRDGGENNAYKIFRSRVEKRNNPNTISYLKLFMTTMKMKNYFCHGHQYKMWKRQGGVVNNARKILCAWVRREILYIRKMFLLFGAVHNYNDWKTIFWMEGYNRRQNLKKCKNLTVKGCLLKNQQELFAGGSLKHRTVVLKKLGSDYCSTDFIQWWTIEVYKLSLESYNLDIVFNSLSRQRTIVQINRKQLWS